MFNVGDRVICTSGSNKGKVGTFLRKSSDFEGKPRILVKFDGEEWESNLWEHRFAHFDPKLALYDKIKQMERRQTWKRNLV